MSLRRLHHDQPDSFAFTQANSAWAEQLIAKYPEGRQASAVIPLLWRGQEQEGWVTRPMIEEVARMLGMAEIRVLEVATFYFMFQLQPTGSVAHIQICGTTSCMICGAEDLVSICKEKIAPSPHQISADGKFSWEEVECLGACSNAPMAQIGKDYYEDLTVDGLADLIDRMAAGEVPRPGPQNGRWASEPADGLTSLHGELGHEANASVDIATQLSDTLKRIDGSDPLPDWSGARSSGPRADRPPASGGSPAEPEAEEPPSKEEAEAAAPLPSDKAAAASPDEQRAAATSQTSVEFEPGDDDKPELLTQARASGADDLKRIKGIGPKLEKLCNQLGIYHFDQIATWSDREVAWVDHHLEGFKGRIERDEWVAQARDFADE